MYEETWLEKYGSKLLLGVLATFAIMITVVIYMSVQHHGRLYDQCLQDGKKEYECYALVYKGNR